MPAHFTHIHTVRRVADLLTNPETTSFDVAGTHWQQSLTASNRKTASYSTAAPRRQCACNSRAQRQQLQNAT